MNTVKKGDKYEDKCFEIISNFVNEGKLGIIPDQYKIYQKKGYSSIDRKDKIVFDISIEVWPPGADNYSILHIIECKDYSTKKIPVDDVEEFYAKVTQVTGLNVKGVFISSSGFQKGAFTYAESKKMMLVEANENITANIILYKVDRHKQKNFEKDLYKDGDSMPTQYKQALEVHRLKKLMDKVLIAAFVRHVKNNISTIRNREVPVLSAENIDEFVFAIIKAYHPEIIQSHTKLPIKSFITALKETFDLSIVSYDFTETDEKGQRIRSCCSFPEKCIRIDRALINTPSYSFIIGHEIGHYFLHNKLQIDQNAYDELKDSKFSFKLGKHVLKNNKNWIEWQANQFACSLILPKNSLLFRFHEIQEKEGLISGRPLYIDQQRCTQITYYKIIAHLARFFNTTKRSVIYRLNGLDLIDDRLIVKSIGQILGDMAKSEDDITFDLELD